MKDTTSQDSKPGSWSEKRASVITAEVRNASTTIHLPDWHRWVLRQLVGIWGVDAQDVVSRIIHDWIDGHGPSVLSGYGITWDRYLADIRQTHQGQVDKITDKHRPPAVSAWTFGPSPDEDKIATPPTAETAETAR